MIRNAMFYLNQNKPSVFDTVRVCAELCRERGIEPIFFEANREELIEKLGDEAETARYLPEPEAGTVDMLFVFGGDGTVLRALDMYVDRDIPILGSTSGGWAFCWRRRRRSCRRRWICSFAANTPSSGA